MPRINNTAPAAIARRAKRLFAPALAALLLVLPACGASPAVGPGPAGQSAPPAESSALPATAGQSGRPPLHPAGSLRLLLSEIMSIPAAGAQTGHGLYEIAPASGSRYNDDDYSHIVYTDYATRRQAVLCPVSGCSHDGAACPGRLPLPSYRYRIFEAGGGIVLFERSMEEYSFHDDTGAFSGLRVLSTGAVYLVDADGGNRRTLYTPPANRMSEDSFFTDDEYLYAIYNIPPNDFSSPHWEYDKERLLVRIHLGTGAATDLAPLENGHNYPIGILDGRLLFTQLVYPVPLRDIGYDAPNYLYNLQSGTRIFYTVDPASGATEPLPGELPDWYHAGGYHYKGGYYYTMSDDASVYRLDLATGEHSTVLEGLPGHYTYLTGLWDGRLAGTDTDMTGYDDAKAMRGEDPGEVTHSYFYLNLDDARPAPTPLALIRTTTERYDDEVYHYSEPVYPIADGVEWYVATYEYINDAYSYTAIRVLISKEDYWAGSPDYLPVVVVE